MSKAGLHFKKIQVIRAPGFENRGFTVSNLSPGVNIIHGPNASGKTTLARSIQDLLWPSVAREQVHIFGYFDLDGEEWRIEVEARSAKYQRNGHEDNGPILPSVDQKERYSLALHELLQHEIRNQSFAEAIQRESVGGYDLTAAAEELGLRNTPSGQTNVVKAAIQSLGNWKEVQGTVETLRREEGGLPGLRRELEEAKHALDRVELLNLAVTHAKARESLKDAQIELDTLPKVLAIISGIEAETAEGLQADIADWQGKKELAERKQRQAKKDIAKIALPEDGLPAGFLDELKAMRDVLVTLESTGQQYEQTLSRARGQRKNACKDIGDRIPEEKLEQLDPVAWGELAKFTKRAERAHANREQRDAVEHWLKPDDELEADSEALERGRRSLEAWLQEPPLTLDDHRRMRRLAVLSSLLVAAAGTLLGLLIHPGFHTVILAAGGILWYGFWRTGRARGDSDPREAHRYQFTKLDLDMPPTWTSDDVRERLDSIYRDIARLKLAEERKQRWDTRRDDTKELDTLLAEVEKEHAELQQRFGVAPDTTEIELFVLANAVSRWQEAHGNVVALQATQATIKTQIDNKREVLNSKLAVYGYDPIKTAADATGHIRNLDKRSELHSTATIALGLAEATISGANENTEKLQEKNDSMFTKLGLEVGDVARLRELCTMRPTYTERKQSVDEAQGLLKHEIRKLEAHPDFESELKETPVADLEEALREEQEKAHQYEGIRDSIRDIENATKHARNEHAVEDALANKERTLDALTKQLEGDYAAMVGHQLMEHLRAATADAGRPEVFGRAREILSTITRGCYRLDLEEGTPVTFRAYDTIKEKGYALDELSSATRLQVLLAVRIAFVECQEQAVCLPLLFDETLANTDDCKAQMIIQSAIELARAGRQVFYFSAQGDEVAKWFAALQNVEDVDYIVKDLAEVQNLDGHVEVPDLSNFIVHTPIPPDPNGLDHRSYRERLGLSPFDPRQGIGAAHLWYIVDDPNLLYDFLKLGIERWGQLETLINTGGNALVTDDQKVLKALEQNARALGEFVRCWHIGRGNPVDRQALEDSRAVSEKFIDQMSELAYQYDGNARSLMQALRNGKVPGFWESKKDDLEAYFEENGYLDPVEPLQSEEIRLRVAGEFVHADVAREAAGARADALLVRLAAC